MANAILYNQGSHPTGALKSGTMSMNVSPSLDVGALKWRNGFENNKWKTQFTRWNQLRFQNEVLLDDNLIKNDGLSTLEFIEHGRTHENKITHINIGI